MLQLKNNIFSKEDLLGFIKEHWLYSEFADWFIAKSLQSIKKDILDDIKHTKDHSMYMSDYYHRVTKPKRIANN